MATKFRSANVLGAVLLLALPAVAQVKYGDTTFNANGLISTGYTASYGNMTDSTHNWTVGGVGTVSGSYYSPNFLSFTVSPYLNQSRANSSFQSISSASGVTASANLFAGSRFPGSVNYSEAYNSDGNYSIPGLANYVTHGNASSFGVNWSENLPDAPSLSAGFQLGKSHYSVYGTNDQGKDSFHSLNVHSGYRWAGFNLGAYYMNGGNVADIPQLIVAQPTQMHTNTNGFGFNASHTLPWQGSFSTGVNRSSWKSDYLAYRSNGTIDTVNVTAAARPQEKVGLSASLNYSDNLTGQIVQSVIGVGGVFPLLNGNQTSDSLDVLGTVSYAPMRNLQTAAFAERRTQSFLGETYGLQSYGGSASFMFKLLNGTMNSSVMLSANSADKTGQDTVGFSTNENYTSEVHNWHFNGTFGYAQNMQTLLVTYTNSYYNFSGSLHRNWGAFGVSMGAGGARTAISAQSGASSDSQTYHAGVGYGQWITTNGSYSKSNGQALLTGAGLVGVPVPPPTLPSDLISLYGGESYSFAATSAPVSKLVLSASYGKSISSTQSQSIASSNQNNQFNSLIQYQYRRLYFTSGYARLQQGFSIAGTKPQTISTYYMGLSRWFNFF